MYITMDTQRPWMDGLVAAFGGSAASARQLFAQGRLDEACLAIDTEIASTRTPTADALMLRAQILLAMSSFRPAIAAFARVIALAPLAGSPEFGLAIALGESGDSYAAVLAARRALAKGMDTPGVRFVLGRALFDAGYVEESESELRVVVDRAPSRVDAHTSLADVVWMRTGDIAAATAALDDSLHQSPEFSALRRVKSRLLETAGLAELAYEELVMGLGTDRDNVDLHIDAAQASVKWDPALALAHAEQAIRLAPHHPNALGTHAHVLLAAGFADHALAVADRLIARNPHDGHATAVRATAMRMMGNPAYAQMYDYAHHVQAGMLDVPNGWNTLEHYLKDLAVALHARHDHLRAHPVAQTLRHGTQTQLRFEGAHEAAIGAFASAINGPIRRYIDSIRADDPTLKRPKGHGFSIRDAWSVRLRDGGYHFNHYHGKGWLSSACYIELPASVGSPGGEGWLQFGEPMMRTSPALPAEYFVKPEPGLLVLFPSWMWHGTVPFAARENEHRLSVAFDVVPAAR
ncbi:MAG: putative 2OG-Fe(II) oxygenase [Dokdonella sp.]|uniref:putative 2OG-Fe(II) oxygenase n=1 Tax=Dokdonella sp. TaxID=2291710 RepID=UPI003266B0DF